MRNDFLKDKVVVITGSGRGIGKALAEHVGKLGAKVILNGRTKETLEETASFLQGKGIGCHYFQADISDYQESVRLIEYAVNCYGKIDVLVNNAGIASRGLFAETQAGVWDNVLRINTLGCIYPVIAALSHLKKSRGSIVFVSSIAGRAGTPGLSAYSASKMALTALAEALDIELSNDGIHVGIVYVGFTINDPEKQILDGNGVMKKITNRPANLQLKPEMVAKAITRVIVRRKRMKVLSLLGHLQSFFFLFPPIKRIILKSAFRKYYEKYKD